MTAEQVKNLIPTFDGENSLTIFDAFEFYKRTLSKSGINKAAWGSIVLSKITGEAKTRVTADAARDQDLDKIQKSLLRYYESSLVATKAIMQAHERIGTIPDPHERAGLQGTLKVLQLHAEVIDNSDRYLALTPEKTAASNLMNGANVETLLNLLPQRVRMDTPGLSKVELDEYRRKTQYKTFKDWIDTTKLNILEQGVRAGETYETHVSLIAGNDSRQSNQRQGGSTGRQSNNYPPKGNNQTPSQNKQRDSKYDPCGFCNIIKKSNSLPYGHLPFDDTHKTP